MGRWLAIVLIIVAMLAGCERKKKRDGEPCSDDSECQGASTCLKSKYDPSQGVCVGPGGTGCPCGCDRSHEVVAALETKPREAALLEIDQRIDVIYERETAGYITEDMVAHRLRLVELRREIEPLRQMPGAALAGDRAAARALRRRLPQHGDALRVRSELVVHARHHEVVNGRLKELRAAYSLWLDLENHSDERRLLTTPLIRATCAGQSFVMPVGRWYVEGGHGERWHGVLEPRAAQTVVVIGYLDDHQPKAGADVTATIAVGGLELQTHTRVRGRYNRR